MAAKKKAKTKKVTKKKVAKKKTAPVDEPLAPAPGRSADIRDVKRYAELLTEKIDVDDKLKKLKAQITKAAPAVLEYFQRQGVEQVAAGSRTLYLERQIHTSKNPDVTTAQACTMLEKIGLPDYTGSSVKIKSLGAYVRELEKDGQELMMIEEQFGGAFRCVEVFKIGSRKR